MLAGEGAALDTTTAAGKLAFGIFAALAEFERALIVERTKAGLASARARGRYDFIVPSGSEVASLASARARGRYGGAPFKMTPAKLRLAQAAMGQPGTKMGELCAELGVSRQTLYRHVDPQGRLRPDGDRLLGRTLPRPGVARGGPQAPA